MVKIHQGRWISSATRISPFPVWEKTTDSRSIFSKGITIRSSSWVIVARGVGNLESSRRYLARAPGGHQALNGGLV